MSEQLDGLISFFSSHYAIRANSLLKRAGIASEVIPGPKELSPNCGVALRIPHDNREQILQILEDKKVQIDMLHHYQPRIEDWDKP